MGLVHMTVQIFICAEIISGGHTRKAYYIHPRYGRLDSLTLEYGAASISYTTADQRSSKVQKHIHQPTR
jgi:hypothetical protein